jgi:hypothetical protein
MAYCSFLRRAILPFILSTALVACSAEGLVPPAGIDGGTRVSSIRASGPRPPAPMRQQAFPAPAAPVSQTSGSNPDYLDTPNLAGTTGGGDVYEQPLPDVQSQRQAAPLTQASRQSPKRLPMIDSDEAMASQGAPQSLQVPSEGINMDAELGAEPVVGLAQEQHEMIAEGEASQPVVDGIGTDNPAQRNQPRRLPQPDAGVQLKRSGAAATWPDQSPVRQPSRSQAEPMQAQPQQVAMLPRLQSPMAPSTPQFPTVMPASEASCRSQLRKLGVEFRDLPRVENGPTCGIDYPLQLSGLGGDIDIKPATTLNCQVTLAFAKWVKYELAPSSRARYLSGIQKIVPLGGYSCRKMNSRASNPWSEHAKGNAIDIGTIQLKSGKEIDIRKKGFFAFREKGLLKAVRTDSCKYFSTVLGPGSDPDHWNHFHFDLRTRKSGYRHCSV